MKIFFIGFNRNYSTLPKDYADAFNKYHLEIPYYYARDGKNDVTIFTPDYEDDGISFENGGSLTCKKRDSFNLFKGNADVVVHWRSWFEEFFDSSAENFIHLCDHSYSDEWKIKVSHSFNDSKLSGVLCYASWHKRYLKSKLFFLPDLAFFVNVTLGVDTEIYYPKDKDTHSMLWSSDPGRGLSGALDLVAKLYSCDKRFRLHVCFPDYCKISKIDHPAVVWHGSLNNGVELWDLFNCSAILPYTSTFLEPSSRAHRQAQAAGAMVLYPPNMGSPSELIQNGLTGIVEPIGKWSSIILKNVNSGEWKVIGDFARVFAETQTWKVQAQNFNKLFDHNNRLIRRGE
jgi:glycosyltransferase involved in cell wall biosynthesis